MSILDSNIIYNIYNDDDDDAPSAIAGDRVNREYKMQVRERGCTTPTSVHLSVHNFIDNHHTHTHTHMYIYVYIYMCVRIIYTYKYIYVCIYKYIYIYITAGTPYE